MPLASDPAYRRDTDDPQGPGTRDYPTQPEGPSLGIRCSARSSIDSFATHHRRAILPTSEVATRSKKGPLSSSHADLLSVEWTSGTCTSGWLFHGLRWPERP